MMVALAYGATLVLPPPGTIGPAGLLSYLERERVSVIDLTPGYWHELLAIAEPADRRLRSVRLMITGGEMADPADCRAAMRAAPGARLLNAYGLTETTITSALSEVGAGGTAGDRAAPQADLVPAGRPIGHTRIMVLDERLSPVPGGAVGEIYVSGCGVARGYPGRTALTAERFLPGVAQNPGGRMYRTGDLGRWRPDGQLEITGRADRQLKVSGFRVEPGEIESVLAEHPDIGQAAVVATGHGPGRGRLAAYYTLRRPARLAPGPHDLRRYLRARLPGYMVPAVFVPLDRMPSDLAGEPAGGGQPRVDFARETELRGSARLRADPRSARPDWRRPLEILLTGSTGFLGIHLLRELLDATSGRVWCLVRARDTAHALARIADAAARRGLPALPAGRVIPLPGDLAAPRLGLAPGEFRELTRSIDIIYHAGAAVNFICPYSELRAANVTGTREVIRLAAAAGGIPVHYVSTTAVLAGLGVTGVREVTEDTPLAHADRLRVGYVETKFVAEELLRKAGRAGLPVAIYRPLDIVGSVRAGVRDTGTEMCALIKFITDTGLAPDIALPLDFVPADTCAAAIRRISCLEEATGRTYHLASRDRALLGTVVDRLRDHGFGIIEVPFATWVSALQRFAARNPAHPMTPFVPLFTDYDPATGLTPAQMYLGHVFPRYTRSNTERALRGTGVAFPPVNGPLLDSNIGYLIAARYLTAPRGSLIPAPRAPSRVPERNARLGRIVQMGFTARQLGLGQSAGLWSRVSFLYTSLVTVLKLRGRPLPEIRIRRASLSVTNHSKARNAGHYCTAGPA